MLLAEYALTPHVFKRESYDNDQIGLRNLQDIYRPLIHHSIVRNLRGGTWLTEVLNTNDSLSPKTKEIMRKLGTRRLIDFHSVNSNDPVSEDDWCNEALASHNSSNLDGVIITNNTIDKFKKSRIVERIDNLQNNKEWWNKDTIKIQKSISEYERVFSKLFKHSNSLMFIDPYLDPSDLKYKNFFKFLLQSIGTRDLKPTIELHRRWTINDKWYSVFDNELGTEFRAAGVQLHVFIWDKFHDRYLISDLLGISITSGFDTNTDPSSTVILNRLPKNISDGVQKEFDPASPMHTLHEKFEI